MGSDRARTTYDPKQQYRSVVMQQGRVTLEADWNEASQIFSEELRRETLDFVGPCGTPDNGYLVAPSGDSAAATYNQIQFVITTGSDDLRSDSSASATLLDGNGAAIQVITLKSQNQAAWGNNSTQTIVSSLTAALSADDIDQINITLTSTTGASLSADNWNVQSVTITLSNNGFASVQLLNKSGNPLARLTQSQPTLTLNPPHFTIGDRFDFSVQPGTMYVGGIRVELLQPVQYSNQPDWQDYGPEDPDWVDLPNLEGSPSSTDEFVYLLLREQEVSAVEDPDLKDVALGGPDTAQRTRLLQRFARVASGSTCASGLAAAQTKWQSEGLYFDSRTMRLKSPSTLQVSFSSQGQDTGPCQPQAQGGYLDPDNQLIRVQISGIDAATGNPKFLWGFDDASFLYRINVDPTSPQNLVFQSVPVDAEHQPVTTQAVEVLRTAAELPNGGEIASLSGFVFTLDNNYNPDMQSIVLPSGVSLPNDYTGSNASPAGQLYLRVWQQEVVFTPGQAIALGDTGLLVALGAGGSQFHLGDYWMFAMRPATPQTVYPERYQQMPQPPDGPCLWACPLGVIAWRRGFGKLIADCRNKMCNLVDLCKKQEGCCTISLRAQDLGAKRTFQDVIYQASSPTMTVYAANAGAPGNDINIKISNVQTDATQPSFDLTVTETDSYFGLTTATSGSGIEEIIGDEEGGPNDGLGHVLVGSVQPGLFPLEYQTVTFSGGDANTPAQADFMDTSNKQVVFTLQARNAGADGNLTQATIFNVTGSPPTFDLAVTWQKTLSGVNMATLFSRINNELGYEIFASQPESMVPAFPAEGVTQLSGGIEPNPSTQTSASYASASIFGYPGKICLRPGSYSLSEPVVFGPEQSGVTIEACGGATLVMDGEADPLDFVSGLIQLNGTQDVTLKGITFAMPRIADFQKRFPLAGLRAKTLEQMGEAFLPHVDASMAVSISGCQSISIEECTFQFPPLQIEEELFAAGVFASADCLDITVKENSFLGPESLKAVASTTTGAPAFSIAAGYVQTDSLSLLALSRDLTTVTGGTLIPSTLDNIVISENSFENLFFPVMIMSNLGAARFENNLVRSCATGFTLVPLESVAAVNVAGALDFRPQILQSPAMQRMLSLAVTYPRAATFTAQRQIVLDTAAPPPAATASLASSGSASPVSSGPAPSVTPSSPLTNLKINRTSLVPRITPSIAHIAISPRPSTPAPSPTPAAPMPTPAPAPAPTPTPAPGSAPGAVSLLKNFSPLNLRVADFLTKVTTPQMFIGWFGIDLRFNVLFSNNDVDANLANESMWALTVIDTAAQPSLTAAGGASSLPTSFGAVTLSGNKLRNWSSVDTAPLMVRFCAATGNVILNEEYAASAAAGANSLSIVAFDSAGLNIASAAVTGNVLYGTAVLPAHTDTATGAVLPDWTTYNYYRK